MDRPKEDDRELIQFKELYKSIAPMLIFYAGKYVNAVTAEDLVQDVFLKVWQKRTFLFLKEGIKTYLYRSVQHACLDYLKHQELVFLRQKRKRPICSVFSAAGPEKP